VLRKEHGRFDRWGYGILGLMIAVYSMYFFVRMNLTLAMPYFQDSLHFNKTDLGLIITLQFMVFGIGKFINAFFSDILKPKTFLAIGLIGSGLMSLAIGSSTSLIHIGFFWCLNSFFQSLSWPQCVRLMSEWYSSSQLGTRWSIITLSNPIGTAVVSAVLPLLVVNYSWHMVFWIPGVAAILTGIGTFFLPLDLPKSLGLLSLDERFNIKRPELQKDSNSSISWSILKEIMKNVKLWYVVFATSCIYIVKGGFTTWAFIYLRDFKHLSLKEIALLMTLFEAFGFLGILMTGVFLDRLFKDSRSLVGAIYLGMTMICFVLLVVFPANQLWLDALILGALGFSLYGPQIVVGVASIDFSSKEAAVAANGFVGLMSYALPSIITGVGLGTLTQNYGWSATLMMFFIFSGIALALFWRLNYRQKKKDATSGVSSSPVNENEKKENLVNAS
jgi:OPA family sugar phosphate sensor protein UhpC-like MFS transporter